MVGRTDTPRKTEINPVSICRETIHKEECTIEDLTRAADGSKFTWDFLKMPKNYRETTVGPSDVEKCIKNCDTQLETSLFYITPCNPNPKNAFNIQLSYTKHKNCVRSCK